MKKKIGSHQTLSDDILMRSIKIFDIGYITILYIFISLISATFIDKVMGEFDEKKEKQKSALKLTLEFILTIWLYGILIYVVRNLIELVPFPLEGFHGFSHKQVKELDSAMVFTFTFVLFNRYLKSKLDFYYRFIQKHF
jgi:hypothetical protein